MRPGQSNKRGRGRGGRKGPSPLSRSYESNGPDVKIRGTAQHIADKYVNLARDAQSAGDTVLSQAYQQHAEHFYRVVAAAQQQMNQNVNVKRADDPIDTEEGEDREGREGFDPSDPDTPQPDVNADANGSGENRRNRDDDDGDGDRRPRRNRGRQRRGRGDERGDERSAGRDDTRERAERSDAVRADAPHEASGDSVPAEAASQNGDASDSSGASSEDKPRRAPRQRKSSVDVEDRFEPDSASAAEPPKPVSLGDDVPPVQAAPDES